MLSSSVPTPTPPTSTIHLLHYPSNAQPQFIDSYTFNAPLYDLVALPTKHLFLLTKDALLFASWQTQNGLQILKEKTFTEIPFFKKNSLQQYYTGAAQFYEKPSFAMDNIEETLFFLNPQGLYKIHYEHALPAAKPLSIAVMTTTKKLTPQTSSPIPLYVIAIGMKEQDKVYLLVAKQNAPKLWHLKHIIHGEKGTQFGTSVALSSQWLAVGATGLKTNNKIQGGAILYRLTETDVGCALLPIGKRYPHHSRLFSPFQSRLLCGRLQSTPRHRRNRTQGKITKKSAPSSSIASLKTNQYPSHRPKIASPLLLNTLLLSLSPPLSRIRTPQSAIV